MEPSSRRDFLKHSGLLAGSSFAAVSLPHGLFHNGGREELRIGLIGCGGRGTGAVANALTADPRTKLVAMADVFRDQLDSSLRNLQRNPGVEGRIDVPPERQFVGFDGYRGVIENCDVVLLCATPHFRPKHLRAAIEAGKHVFCEKPVAVDAPGVRHVMESSRMAEEKGLSLVSGLCYRYQDAKIETIQRVHEGAIGDVVALQCSYNTGALWHRGNNPEWSEMEYQLRNWLYFTWLSGDHIAEQSIHSIDKCLWAMGDVAPAKVTASGGRIVRTDQKYGNVFDHFNTTFEWANGVRLFHSCRQWEGASSDVSDFVFGTKGTAAIQSHRVQSGDEVWRFRGKPEDMYVSEHRSLFRSIREGKPINDGDYMCKSTLMAIMGRMAAYTGQTLTWEQALHSQLDLSPKAYEWGDVEEQPIARPGKTQFV